MSPTPGPTHIYTHWRAWALFLPCIRAQLIPTFTHALAGSSPFLLPCISADDAAYRRAKTKRMNISHFEPKAVIGRGSFSTVCDWRPRSLYLFLRSGGEERWGEEGGGIEMRVRGPLYFGFSCQFPVENDAGSSRFVCTLAGWSGCHGLETANQDGESRRVIISRDARSLCSLPYSFFLRRMSPRPIDDLTYYSPPL